MCGIAGFFHSPRDPGDHPAIIENMLRAIAHRGPDGTGYFVDGVCAFGTTRLSIIDLQSGTQPLSDATGRYWICYNGEVYNYLELRSELEAKGRVFRTKSDTEVVLQSWIQWGEGCLRKLNGGYAFAIYDREGAELVLARDRFGKRPLFYTGGAQGFAFASEMKAFLALPGFRFEQAPEQIQSILAQWTPLPEQSGFRGIRSLAMGSWLRVRERGVVEQPYESLTLRPGAAPSSEAEAVELVRQRIAESVALRLRSDVEVGVNLSGGIDSAIVALLTCDRAKARVRTFSVEFDDPKLDESREQREMAKFLGTSHTAVRIGHEEIARHFPKAIYQAEVPAFRSAFVPMFLLAQATRREGIKVVLSGEGADEAFLGYDLYKETMLRTAWNTCDESWRRARLAQLYPHLDHYQPQDIAAITGLYHQFSEERMPGLFSHELRFQNGRFSARLVKRPGDPFRPIQELVGRAPGYLEMTPVERAQWLEYKTLLAGYLLSTQGDRMSLAHGVENRCPFLDPAVVEAACAVNGRFDDGFEEKRLLRLAFRDRLPASIAGKRKFPYRAPECAAFAADAPEYLELLLSDVELAKIPYLDAKFARALTKKALSTPAAEISTKENQAFIFLLSLAFLHHFFVERRGAPRGRVESPLVRVVDLRPSSVAGWGQDSQGNFDSAT
jgi:asparagine synthase (glutamine-hydrolysing)